MLRSTLGAPAAPQLPKAVMFESDLQARWVRLQTFSNMRRLA